VHIYYINLDTQPERRARIEWQLGELGLRAERIRATTPADIPEDVLTRYCPGPAPWWLTAPELACTFSHIAAIESIANGSDKCGLILEDDVVLSAPFGLFAAEYERIVSDIEIVKLDGSGDHPLVAPGPSLEVCGTALRKVTSFRVGAGAYIITKGAAQSLLASPRLLETPIDCSLYHPFYFASRKLVVRHADPALCTHRTGLDTDSTLERSRVAARRDKRARRTLRNLLLRAISQRGLQLYDGLQMLVGARRKRIGVPESLGTPERVSSGNSSL
jgi:glycosyl transferase, family 25